MKNRFTPFVAAVCVLAAVSIQGPDVASALNFDLSDLSMLQLNGSAKPAVDDQGRAVLRLTDVGTQSGSAFTADPVLFGDDYSFSTRFAFRIHDSGGLSDADGIGADGIVFVLQTASSYAVGWEGGNIGYLPLTPSLGIEFDTWKNVPVADDIDGNHVGIDVNGMIASLASVPVAQRMNDGDIWHAWIEYDGMTRLLQVWLSPFADRSDTALLSRNIDLASLLGGQEVYAGFTSGTAGGWGKHDILSWNLDATGVPEPASIFLLGVSLIGMASLRRLLDSR